MAAHATDTGIDKIRVENVSKEYGAHQVRALQEVSLRIQTGEFVALMGSSGCGKSTLLNLLGAMDQPSTGEIHIQTATGILSLKSLDEMGLTRFRREQVGFVFQFFNLLSTLTVRENIALPLALAGTDSPRTQTDRVEEFLAQVGLQGRQDFFPAQLSGGEMQRVAIARALIHDPSIILADEPTGNLDSENGAHILELLKDISSRQGKTIIMATHSEEAAHYANRTLRMRDGRLLQEAPSV